MYGFAAALAAAIAVVGCMLAQLAGRIAAARAATPPPAPTLTSPPAVDRPPQVGVADSCDPGSFSTTSGGSVTATDYTWFRDSTPVPPVFESHDGTVNSYTPVAGDLGHRLICRETVTDSGNATTASADSGPSAPTAPTAAVTLTRYQPAVSGSIGEAVGGVTVTLGLVRPSADGTIHRRSLRRRPRPRPTEAGAPRSVSPAGVPPDGFGAPGDELTTAYGAPPGGPGTLVPGALTYTDNGSFGAGRRLLRW